VKVTQIGTELPPGELLIKRHSAMTFDMAFWEDAAATVASDLAGTSVALEITDSTAVTTFTSDISANRAVWTLSSTDTDVTWEQATFQVVLTRDSDRYTILAGPVRIQS
jgi:hypothetical protein